MTAVDAIGAVVGLVDNGHDREPTWGAYSAAVTFAPYPGFFDQQLASITELLDDMLPVDTSDADRSPPDPRPDPDEARLPTG